MLKRQGFGQSTKVPFDDPTDPLYVAPDGSYGTSENPNAGSAALRYGMKGELVRDLQAALLSLGFNPGAVDGIFGKTTLAAVRAFQTAAKVQVDGIVGPATWQALRAAAAAKKRGEPAPAPTVGTQTDPIVQAAQIQQQPAEQKFCWPGDYACAGVDPPWLNTSPPAPPPQDSLVLPVALVGAALGGIMGYAYNGRPLGGAVGLGVGGLGAWALWSFIEAY
jgi:peptidoglycan hydrolase-like protein with peptidoglycan-binding domain